MNFQKALTACFMLSIWTLTSCNNNKKEDPIPAHPTISSNIPVQHATGVAVNIAVQFTFSEAMDPATINSTTVTLNQGATEVAGTVTLSNKTSSFTPSANLAYNTLYTATISSGAKSLSGMALETPFVISFNTEESIDTTAPLIVSTDPLSNAVAVSRNKTVSITFNEAMNAASINNTTFVLKQGTTPIVGTVDYSGAIATFTSNTDLSANKTYTATITTGAKDLSGNALANATTWSFITGGTSTVLATVNLGGASNYVILAKTAINNNPTSVITGHLGLSPAATSYITGLSLVDFTGYATSPQVTGNVYAADMADPTPTNLTVAVNNMITAYNDAAGRPSPDFLELATGNIGGKTLEAGLYKWTGTVTIPADLTLTGGADDVWIFQIDGDLTQSANVSVTLNGGAQAKNIFWQVAGEATFGSTSHIEGNILSMTGITFLTGASMNGRALAQTAVILDANVITKVD